jgi:hypothetical protein
LFETAWQIAEKYKFDDSLRLTPKQISQFNAIIMDKDYVRQYERLEFISEDFKAYPAFYYYWGSAALHASQVSEISEESRNSYIESAISHYEQYCQFSQKDYQLLREDPIVGQCVFEYIAALIWYQDFGLHSSVIKTENLQSKKMDLLSMVQASSKNSLDVQQMCATAYIELGMYDEASKLLRMLVNEDFNKEANSQILSTIYVSQMIEEKSVSGELQDKYNRLRTYVGDARLLYPIPSDFNTIDKELLDKSFHNYRKLVIVKEMVEALQLYFDRIELDFKEIWLSNEYVADKLIALFADIARALHPLCPNSEELLSEGWQQSIKNVSDRHTFYADNQVRKNSDVKLAKIVSICISEVLRIFCDNLNQAKNAKQISALEQEVHNFKQTNEIVKGSFAEGTPVEYGKIKSAITGKDTDRLTIENNKYNALMGILKKKEHSGDNIVFSDKKGVVVCYSGDLKLRQYLKDNDLAGEFVDDQVLMVLEDINRPFGIFEPYHDLAITTDRVCYIEAQNRKGKRSIQSASYQDVECEINKQYVAITSECKYKEKEVNYHCLARLLDELRKEYAKYSNGQDKFADRIDVKRLMPNDYRLLLSR